MSLQFTDAEKTARALLGCEISHFSSQGVTRGIIVETEAYYQHDPASHSFKGETQRNAAMFLEGGHVYIYFTYGMHYCLNIVTGKEGDGQAVLLRALEPTEGIALMHERRGLKSEKQLTNGPAKLVQAMGIDQTKNGLWLAQASIQIERKYTPKQISISKRRGITRAKDAPLRFYISDNPYVS